MHIVALFRERLVSRRNWQGWTQVELAEKGGFSHRSIAAWETGETAPSLDNLVKLAETLETSVGWLIGELPADGGAVLTESAAKPVWPYLSEKTLRSAISDLSQMQTEDGAALIHLERIVGELRTRARATASRPAAIGGVNSARVADAAAASMDAAEAASGAVRESAPKSGVAGPSASKRSPGSGAGKAS